MVMDNPDLGEASSPSTLCDRHLWLSPRATPLVMSHCNTSVKIALSIVVV